MDYVIFRRKDGDEEPFGSMEDIEPNEDLREYPPGTYPYRFLTIEENGLYFVTRKTFADADVFSEEEVEAIIPFLKGDVMVRQVTWK